MYRFVSALIVFFALTACVYNRPSPAPGPVPRDVIVVVGEGEVMGKPDVARVELGVEARARDAATAVEAVNNKVKQMIDVLKQLGIAAEDLQTQNFSIHSERAQSEPVPLEEPSAEQGTSARPPSVAPKAAPSPAAGTASVQKRALPRKQRPVTLVYNASNNLRVTVRKLDRLGEVLSRAVEAGANKAWGISFEIDDDAPLVKKARAKAVADARAQATELAKLAGVRLGGVVSISEASLGGPPAPPMAGTFAMARMESVPTEGGQVAVRRQVQVVFAIDHHK